ncbi:hypothetical protein PL684_16600, partial [Phocaeicola vulgatus]|nr:hypothetical protein [Phocaeicola vulgatus]
IRSDVLMISTLMCIKVYANVRFLGDIRILTETDAPFNKHSNILNAISNIGLTEDVIYSNFLNLINAIV